MSWLRFLTLLSFRHWHPDWVINLYYTDGPVVAKNWTSETTDSDIAYVGPDYFPLVPSLNINMVHLSQSDRHPAHQCDIFQWNYLANYPGYYADMDILWLRSLNPEQETYAESDAVLCFERDFNAIGFFGSSGCEIFSKIAAIANTATCGGYQQHGTFAMARAFSGELAGQQGEGSLAAANMREQYPHLRVDVAPDITVYPFIWTELRKIFDDNVSVPKAAAGLHWFGGGVNARKWSNILVEANWRNYNNTFTTCLKKIL